MSDTGRPRPPRTRATLAVVCAAVMLVPVTATGAPVVLPDVAGDLGAGLAATTWVTNAFFLTFAGFMAVTGSLADRTGRRRLFTAGLAVFSVSMLVAAAAPWIGLLVAARVLAGVGAAGALTGGSAILGHTFAGRARTRAFGVFGTGLGVGLAFGPLLAGTLVALWGWRAFFLAAALVVVPLVALTRLLPESSAPSTARPDRLGAVTFTAGLSLLVLGIVEGPDRGWTSPWVVAALAAGAALLAVFVRVERRRADPMIDVALFTQPRFLAIALMPVLLAFAFVAPLVLLPAYFMAVDGLDARAAGLLLVLMTGPTLVVPGLVSAVAHRLRPRTPLVAALVLVAVGAAGLTVLRPDAAVAVLAAPLLCLGAGFGVSLAVLDGAAVSAVAPEQAGTAAGVFNTVRLAGESIAIAVLGSMLTAGTRSGLADRVGPVAADRLTTRVLQGRMPDVPGPVRDAAALAYTGAWHVVLWTIAAGAAAGVVLVVLLHRDRRAVVAAEPYPEPVLADRPSRPTP